MFGGNIGYYIMKYDWRRLGSKLKIEIDHDGVKWLFSSCSYSLLAPISYPLLNTLINYIIFFTRNVDPSSKRILYSTIFFFYIYISCSKIALALVTYAKETRSPWFGLR